VRVEQRETRVDKRELRRENERWNIIIENLELLVNFSPVFRQA